MACPGCINCGGPIVVKADEGCGPDYHDCPGAALGTCEPTDPHPNCPDCGGNGYVTGYVEAILSER